MYTLVLCLGWRVGVVYAIFIVTATAAPTSDLTYLTYHAYLKLSIHLPKIYDITFSSATLGNTEVTRRIHWPAKPLWARKSLLWASLVLTK